MLFRSQNVVAVGLVAGGLGFAAHWVGAVTDVPFGRREFSAQLGDRLLRQVPWALPFLWIALTIACRGVARLILRPWRKLTCYGFWVMGTAALLALLFALARRVPARGRKAARAARPCPSPRSRSRSACATAAG